MFSIINNKNAQIVNKLICELYLKIDYGIAWLVYRSSIKNIECVIRSGDLKMQSVEMLLNDCNDAIRNKREFQIFLWSFRSNPENIHSLVRNEFQNKKYSKEAFNDFIKICDNRLDMSKSLLNDLSIIFSAIFVAFAALLTILTIYREKSPNSMGLLIMIFNLPILTVFAIILLICIPVFLILIGHLRTQIYTWASFKELAIIHQV